MAKTGRQYADEVRELRAAGFDFPASRGYRLVDAANWSHGLKSAVTRAINTFEVEAAEPEPRAEFEEFFADAAGDAQEQWDEIDYFDFSEGEEFDDEESDDYEDDVA